MIRLYEENVTNFDNNGLGVLIDAMTCTVTEKLNGEYELEMTYPVNGVLYDEIQKALKKAKKVEAAPVVKVAPVVAKKVETPKKN